MFCDDILGGVITKLSSVMYLHLKQYIGSSLCFNPASFVVVWKVDAQVKVSRLRMSLRL